MTPEAVEDNFKGMIDGASFTRSNELPSKWSEKNRILRDGTPYPGQFSYRRTPYLKEIVDRLSNHDPKKVIGVMKGAQIGFSTGVIENGIAWIISESPANTMLLSGHADLSEEMMQKLDTVIDNTGLSDLIRPSSIRQNNSRTGDTQKMKEFPSGNLLVGSAGNHKLLRQRSVRYMFVDDFDAVEMKDKESGSTQEMIEQRLAAYYGKMKLFYISTPELKETSNIFPVYLMGDQRKFYVPCPKCGAMIPLEWEVPIDEKETAGITWKLNKGGKLIENSVGYICQECGGFFEDSHKFEMNLAGEWRPTAEPQTSDHCSYHLSSLYAPPGMYDWKHYVQKYLEANPPNGVRNDHKHQTFVNLALGEPWEDPGENPSAHSLEENQRGYKPGTVPDAMSIEDGNGHIIMLTCAADLNGKVEDARLDYEILAWSENGTTYSVDQGSIGTFVKGEGQQKYPQDREKWTYQLDRERSVWGEFEKVLQGDYQTDDGKRTMGILIGGIDAPGHFAVYAYSFLDRTETNCYGLKGKDDDRFISMVRDMPSFNYSKERKDLMLVNVNMVKDKIASLMKLEWDQTQDEKQPDGFMNFPQPEEGKYTFKGFFSHFESERRVTRSNKEGTNVTMRWEKRGGDAENHFWDVRVYNHALRDISISLMARAINDKNFGWKQFAEKVKQYL